MKKKEESEMPDYILSVKDLTMAYSPLEDVVSNVSFNVRRGEFLLVVGENGSGKSTLLKGILGLVPPKSGSIEFKGRDTQKKIGYLSQSVDAVKDFPATVFEVVLSGFVGKKGLFSRINLADRRKAEEIIRYLGIDSLKNCSFGALSGGERQKVLLARALASATLCRPCHKKGCGCHDETFCHTNGLIVLDEPSNGLDPIANKNLFEILQRLCKEKGMTVIMVSHLIRDAVEYADRVLHLGGGVKFFGSCSDYLESPYGKGFARGEALGEE